MPHSIQARLRHTGCSFLLAAHQSRRPCWPSPPSRTSPPSPTCHTVVPSAPARTTSRPTPTALTSAPLTAIAKAHAPARVPGGARELPAAPQVSVDHRRRIRRRRRRRFRSRRFRRRFRRFRRRFRRRRFRRPRFCHRRRCHLRRLRPRRLVATRHHRRCLRRRRRCHHCRLPQPRWLASASRVVRAASPTGPSRSRARRSARWRRPSWV